ncbi:MAG TPA: hypothetical protein ENL06_00660 [Candidatus Portnoybacteria bacterium]|nr:hypothetical protein [Candidatus Portnoybacteria bacterium]
MWQSFVKTGRSLVNITPILMGTILLVGLGEALVPRSFYVKIFSDGYFGGLLVGDVIGSISAGNPIVSYVLGGEMLKQGVGLMAVTTFIVSWVTIGLIQLPSEAMILGKRFAIVRNITAFVLSLVVAVVTVLIFRII